MFASPVFVAERAGGDVVARSDRLEVGAEAACIVEVAKKEKFDCLIEPATLDAMSRLTEHTTVIHIAAHCRPGRDGAIVTLEAEHGGGVETNAAALGEALEEGFKHHTPELAVLTCCHSELLVGDFHKAGGEFPWLASGRA